MPSCFDCGLCGSLTLPFLLKVRPAFETFQGIISRLEIAFQRVRLTQKVKIVLAMGIWPISCICVVDV